VKIISQIFIILLFFVLGEIVSLAITAIIPSVFLPGSIIGMILLLIALVTKVVKIDDVDEVGTFLTNNMAFFFIPAAVSVMEYFDLLQSVAIQILLICIISVIITFFIVGYVVKLTVYLQSKYSSNKGEENV